MATQTDALGDELAQAGIAPDASGNLVAGGDSKGEDAEEPATAGSSKPAEDDIGPGPGLALVMLLLFPFIASLQFGLAFSAVGFSSLGYGLYQAWKRTDGQGMQLVLKGPFRVGQGPIPAR